jgi:osmotically-inducible protein OsmY
MKKTKHGVEMAPEVITKAAEMPALSEAQSDEKIRMLFEKSYVYRVFLQESSIKTVVKAGVVTLTGSVSGQIRKDLVQATLVNIPGVVEVNNQLGIGNETEAEAKNADYWIGKKVTLTLLFHRNVNATRTVVEVKDGIVTLKGKADSKAQRDLTAEYAKDIEGVKSVKVEMTIADPEEKPERTLGEKIDDASVTAQVRIALLSYASTRTVPAVIQTRNGEVTLTGIARNSAEISLIEKIVTEIQGVCCIKNQMTVQETKTR